MKKFIFLLVCFLSSILFVDAAENKLYFSESGKRLYYDTSLYDDKIFISNLDMIPGTVYVDELEIKNDTKTEYKLYLKVNELEQSDLAIKLLDSVTMKIYLDDKLIYNGYADGLDYTVNKDGIDLQNAIYIGKYKAGSKSILKAETSLVDTYNNIDIEVLSKVEWEFYAEYEEEVIPINPDTGNNFYDNIVYLLLVIMILSIVVYIVSSKFSTRKFVKK